MDQDDDDGIEMLEEYQEPTEYSKSRINWKNVIRALCILGFCVFCILVGIGIVIGIIVGVQNSGSLEAIYAEEWNRKMMYSPEFATEANDNRFNGKLTNYSATGISEREEYYENLLKRISGYNRDDLNYRLFLDMIKMTTLKFKYKSEWMNIDHLENGPHIEIPNVIADTKFEKLQDYTDFLLRLEVIGPQIKDRVLLLKKGIENGVSKPKITMVGVPHQIQSLFLHPVEESVFYAPFLNIPADIPKPEELRAKAKQIIVTSVYPSYQLLYTYMFNEYIPQCRETIAISSLPNGKEYYLYLVKAFTTTSMTPDEIFTLGMSEVTRIHSEMSTIISNIGFNGTFIDFIASLKNDTRFYAKTEEEFLMFIRDIAKRADAELPKLFKTLPSCPYGVRSIIDPEQAKTAPAAYYMAPNEDCSRPGWYYVNTYELTQRPKFVYESTTLHEAVPGHHFQLAIANELKGLPKFRTIDSGHYTSFVEGWALYSESLGDTMGFYKNPYFKFGSLGDEMLRACRLVVDVGMHWKSWTRESAINFMKINTPLSELDITSEIDRYITWPGQALAYKIGELKIKELRDLAKTALKGKFDIRLFHDEVLKHGSLPLGILQEVIQSWINLMR